LLVIGELAVSANFEAEDFGRCGDVGQGLLLLRWAEVAEERA